LVKSIAPLVQVPMPVLLPPEGAGGREGGDDRVAVGTLVVLLAGSWASYQGTSSFWPSVRPEVSFGDLGAGDVRVRVVAEADQAEDEVLGDVAVVAVDGGADGRDGALPARLVGIEHLVHRARVVEDDAEQGLLEGAVAFQLAILGSSVRHRRFRAADEGQADARQQTHLHANPLP
jgi:hypothetical protein